jgi:hypothetical protein
MHSTTAKIIALTTALIMTVAVVGYAMAGSLGRVVVTSTPSGAQVVVSGRVVGTTPATLKLPAGQKIRLQIRKSGFKTKSLTLTPKDGKTTKVSVRLKPN